MANENNHKDYSIYAKEIGEILTESLKKEDKGLQRVVLLGELSNSGDSNHVILSPERTYSGNKSSEVVKLDIPFKRVYRDGKKSDHGVFCLKIYEEDRISEHQLDLEVRVSQALHSGLLQQVVNVHGFRQIDRGEDEKSLYLILMDHIGEKTVGKFLLELDSDELEVLQKIGNKEQPETDEEKEIASYLMEMGFVKIKHGKYKWERITTGRFEMEEESLVEKESFQEDKQETLRAVIDTIFATESALYHLVESGEVVLPPRRPYDAKFFEKFDWILMLCGEEAADYEKLKELYEKNIGSIKKREFQMPIFNAFLMNLIEADDSTPAQKIVTATDFYHITKGPWLSSYTDVNEVAKINCGFSEIEYRALWDYAKSVLRPEFKFTQLPEDLRIAQAFERVTYYLGVACNQYMRHHDPEDPLVLTPGLMRYQVKFIKKASKHLLGLLENSSVVDSGNTAEKIFSKQFIDTFSQYFKKLTKKRL